MLQALDYATQLMALMDAIVAAARMQHDVTPLLKVSFVPSFLGSAWCHLILLPKAETLGFLLTCDRLWLTTVLMSETSALSCPQQLQDWLVHHTVCKTNI